MWGTMECGSALAAFLSIIPSVPSFPARNNHQYFEDTSHIIPFPIDTMHHGVRPMGGPFLRLLHSSWMGARRRTDRPDDRRGNSWHGKGVTAMMTPQGAAGKRNYFQRFDSTSANLRLKRAGSARTGLVTVDLQFISSRAAEAVRLSPILRGLSTPISRSARFRAASASRFRSMNKSAARGVSIRGSGD